MHSTSCNLASIFQSLISAVYPLETWQQRRVNIHYLPFPPIHESSRNNPHKSSQEDKLESTALQGLRKFSIESFSGRIILVGNHDSRNTRFLRSLP